MSSISEFVDWEAAIKESEEATKKKWESLPGINKSLYKEKPDVKGMAIELVDKFRSNNNIMVSHLNEGDTRVIPNPIKTCRQAFEAYVKLAPLLRDVTPTAMQSQLWPIILSGYDLIGIAQTSSERTLAYLLPAMVHIDCQTTKRDDRPGPTALIMTPTRDVAQQIEELCEQYCYNSIKSIIVDSDVDYVDKGVEIVIATPGRLNDLCMNQHINLSSVSYLVFDGIYDNQIYIEGIEGNIRKVLLNVRPDRQTILVSDNNSMIMFLIENFMLEPIKVSVGDLPLITANDSSNAQLSAILYEMPVKYDSSKPEMKDRDEYLIDIQSKGKVIKILNQFKNDPSVCIKDDIYSRKYADVFKLLLIGDLEHRDEIIYEIGNVAKFISYLPHLYCSQCFRTDHTYEVCKFCPFHLDETHFFWTCPLFDGKAVRKEGNKETRKYWKRVIDKFGTSCAYWTTGVRFEYLGQLDSEYISCDMEASEGNGINPATQVMICHKFRGINVQVIYYAVINNSDIIVTPSPRYSGTECPQIIRGITRHQAKDDILRIFKKRKVFMLNSKSDMKSLFINSEELTVNKTTILDFAENRHFQDPTEPSRHLSLKDMVFYFLNGKKIQSYDSSWRPGRGHNIEIDTRYTLKLGLKILALRQEGLLDPLYYETIKDVTSNLPKYNQDN